jgi:hypothetical protein
MTTNGEMERGDAERSSPENKNAKAVSSVGKRSSGRLHSRPLTKNKHLLKWVEKIAALTQPARIHWVDGSQREYNDLCMQMVLGGTFYKAQ